MSLIAGTEDSSSSRLDNDASGRHPLDSMFAPRGIAIVGASDRSGWSRYTYANLVQAKYPHPIHLVNHKGGLVHGQQAVKSLDDIDGHVDLAYVLTGPDSLPGIMESAAAKGIVNLVVIAAGFGEMGEEGAERERALAARANELGLRILGPNNLGFINATAATMPWSQMLPWPLETGGVGVLSQSGALGIFLLNYLQGRDVGISHLVTLGNEAMITIAEGIDYLLAQESTKVIALYLESVRHPEAFIDAARRALAAGVPIVAYKAGRGEVGAKVTAAHTGALAGDDKVFDAAFRQLGVIRVDSIEDLVATAGLLAEYGEIPGRRAAFVTGSGAMCGVIGDVAEASGVLLPDLADSTVTGLRESGLPEFATAQNPLDTTGYVVIKPDLLPLCEKVVSKDPGIDVLVINGSVPATPEAAAFMAGSVEWRKELADTSPVPVIPMEFLPTERTLFAREFRRSSGSSYVLESFARGIPALAKAMWWSEKRREIVRPRAGSSPVVEIEGGAGGRWSERQVVELLAGAGVPVVPQRLVRTAQEAESAAGEMPLPLVMKVSSADIAHKTDVGGVVLGLNSPDEVRGAFERMMDTVRSQAPDADIEGAVLSPMRPDGVDLLVGFVRDSVWGLTLVVGLGGVWVEVLKDTAIRLLPVNRDEVKAMLTELKSYPLLTGARGGAVVDLEKLADVICRLADVAAALGDRMTEMEVNPLRVSGESVEVLDAMAVWDEG